MNRTLLQAQSLYADMGKAERRVADWLFSHPGEVLPYAIRELATACETSEATIVRFSRRLGFNGYQDLKLSLASEAEKKIIAPYITKDDTCFDVFEKICNDAYLSLERTKKTLSAEGMARAADAIATANKVVLIGLGSSASVASDASDKLLRACCNSASYGDTHMQTIAVSRLSPGDVLIGISHSGSSKDIVDALRLCKICGATTVCITNHGSSPIVDASDVALFTKSDETKHSILAMSSRIAQLAILDSIYTYIVLNADKASRQAIYNTEIALQNKKY